MNPDYIQFEQYLLNLEETDKSIEEHLKNLNYFSDWCLTQKIEEIDFLEHNVILEYVRYMDNKPVKIGTQNIRLNSIQKYYQHLKKEKIITKNPVKNFRIRDTSKKVVHHPLSESDLQELYKYYVEYLSSRPDWQKNLNQGITQLKMKLVTSLVIFQGLHTGELDKLNVHDINLDNSTLYVPSTARSNSRVIQLNQQQTIPFFQYLNLIPPGQIKLFKDQIQNSFHRTLEILKAFNPMVQNLHHIKASVLINWIKKHGKTKAQYMIGHCWATTTKSYEIQDTSKLSELIKKTHLFG